MTVFPLFITVLSFIVFALSEPTDTSNVIVDVSKLISETSESFICFTMDWWPPNKCDYGTCAWGNTSIINQDLSNPLLAKAIKAMSPVVLRLGGSLADHIVYNVDNPKNCNPFTLDPNDRLGFEGGCFEMTRWDAINELCNPLSTGCNLVFGLNLLYGRTKVPGCNSTWCNYTGTWDPSNVRSFLLYTAKAGYPIKGWELGNELNGNEGVTAHLTSNTEASDFITLHKMIQEIWKEEPPLLIGPDGNYYDPWFQDFLKQNPGISVVTHHMYSLGAGVDPNLVQKIMDPSYLDKVKTTAAGVQSLTKINPNLELWIGEAGGAYNSGHHLVTDAFISGFWYLDQIATFAVYGHKSYCRQALIGGNYGLLNTTTLHPNPDYYSSLLWRKLMGTGVLKVMPDPTTPFLRAYAHCRRGTAGNTAEKGGITLLFLNLSPSISYTINLQLSSNVSASLRLEYHLTAPNNDLHSQQVLLNGNLLDITEDGEIPPLVPKEVDSSTPLVIEAFSYAFIVLPSAGVAVC